MKPIDMNQKQITVEDWKTIHAKFEKERRRILPVKRNQLSLWLGRLVISYNNLENTLATTLTTELVELIGTDETPAQLGDVPPSMRRASDGGLRDIVMATMPFKQKLDFLVALLLKRFSGNPEHLKVIEQFVRLIYAADEYRNKMVHSVWQESYTDFARVKVKTKGQKGLKVEHQDADIKQLREAIKTIDALELMGELYLTNPSVAKKYGFDYAKLEKKLRPDPKIKTYPNVFTIPEK
jgi:hypothetical protein